MLIQSEFRHDNTLVQDRIIANIVRSTMDALSMKLSIDIPDNTCCTFNSPTTKVTYRIDLEFYTNGKFKKIQTINCIESPRMKGKQQQTMDENVIVHRTTTHSFDQDDDNELEKPLMMSLPIDILPPARDANYQCSPYEDALQSYDPAISLVQSL